MAFPALLRCAVAASFVLVSPLVAQDRRQLDDSLMRAEQALDRNNRSAKNWQDLGRVLEAMDQHGFVVKPTAYHSAGISYRRGALDAYTRAIRTDSTYLGAAESQAQLIVSLRARKLNQDFTRQLIVAGRQPGAPAVVHLALARLAWSDGKYQDALKALTNYVVTGDSGVYAVEASRAHAGLGKLDDGARAYTRGLSSITGAGREAYREDINWVARPEEMEVFDSLPLDSVGVWITDFWRQRDALEIREPGERLREHLRRWVYVHQVFTLTRPEDAPIHSEGLRDADQGNVIQGNDPYLSIVLSEAAFSGGGFKLYQRTQWEVDDRGAVYLRHGEPTKRISTPTGPPNESWMYRRATDQPVFHFLSSQALGTTAATTLVASLPLSPEMLMDRGELDPRYQALGDYIQGRRDMLRAYMDNKANPSAGNQELKRAFDELRSGRSARSAVVLGAIASANAGLGTGAAGGNVNSSPTLSTTIPQRAREDGLRGRARVKEAMTSDGFPQEFARDLEAVVQLHGLGINEGAQRRLLTVYAIDGGSLVPQPRPDGNPGWFYPILFRIVAVDQLTGLIRQVDTVRNYLTRDSLRAGQHLTGQLAITVPAGIYRVRLLVKAVGTEAAALGARNGVDLLPASNGPIMSDLVLGRANSGMSWHLGATEIPLNPLNAYPRGTNGELFYELAGLAPGATYETTVAVRKAGDKPTDKPAISISGQFNADASYRQVIQSIGLGQLKPGAYTLQVTLKLTAGGESIIRQQALNILK